MSQVAIRRTASVVAPAMAVFGALMLVGAVAPMFLKNVVGMGKDSASQAAQMIMTGMDIASAVGLVSGGLAIGSLVIWGIKQAIKKGGKKAVIA